MVLVKDLLERPLCFPFPLNGEYIGYSRFRLTSPFRYIAEDGKIYDIPTLFSTDGQSILQITKSLVNSNWSGRGGWGACLHDFLYQSGIVSRLEADRLFREALKRSGVGLIERNVKYRWVRSTGWIVWNRYKKEREGVR